jgi:hypothetical protein
LIRDVPTSLKPPLLNPLPVEKEGKLPDYPLKASLSFVSEIFPNISL